MIQRRGHPLQLVLAVDAIWVAVPKPLAVILILIFVDELERQDHSTFVVFIGRFGNGNDGLRWGDMLSVHECIAFQK